MSPLVSIITPVFNVERFIRATIDSVRAQTHQNWEWILVDDQSTDRTRDLIRAASENDPRIRLVSLEKKTGPAGARNRALRESRGEYVAFIDGDDLWHPEKLKAQLRFMTEHGHEFTFHAYHRISEDGVSAGRSLEVPAFVDYWGLLEKHVIGCLTVMLHLSAIKAKLGELPQMEKGHHEDLMFWLSILKKTGLKAHGLNRDLAEYRVVNRSRSANKFKAALSVWEVYRGHEKLELPMAIRFFASYAINSVIKYRSF